MVTGAASGIGRAIAERLERDGAQVLAVDLEPDPDGPGEPFAADLTTREGNRAAVDAALERFGRLDAVVPNAGFQHVAPVARVPRGPLGRAARAPADEPVPARQVRLAARCARAATGRFVAIASAHALVASPFKAGYVSAKHGVLGLVKTLALEGADARHHRRPPSAPASCARRSSRRQIADQAKAHGMPEERVLEEVILAPHAVKRLIEPDEVRRGGRLPARRPAGARSPARPVTMDLGWTAR